ncbi:Bifunctional PGK/TIM [compost metagenome]
MFHLIKSVVKTIVIAYEPVWAIGTGLTATPEQAQEIHAFIRQLLVEGYDEETANEVSILYGGSCNPSNAASLFSQKDIDGGLIGGASLKSRDFTDIIKTFNS